MAGGSSILVDKLKVFLEPVSKKRKMMPLWEDGILFMRADIVVASPRVGHGGVHYQNEPFV